MRRRISGWSGGSPLRRWEVPSLVAVIALGLAIRIVYIVVTHDRALGVDERVYDEMGRFAADGRWFWASVPYGIPHQSLWKAPGYPAWIQLVYSVFGPERTLIRVLQALIGAVVIALTWLLARRLFDGRVAIAAAGVAAVYPHMWQWEITLHSESLALPLALLVYLAALTGPPTPRRAAVTGALIGLSLLVRPNSFTFLALVLVAWWFSAGTRRALALTGITAAIAVLVVLPWTIRNAVVYDAFVPISVQDTVISGTFNDDAANDPGYPWRWRYYVRRDLDVLKRPRSDPEFRRVLLKRGFDYIKQHPSSVPKAFFWNGLVRTWDIWRPSHVLDQTPFDARSRRVETLALVMYWLLLPLAVAGLWRHRHRRDLVGGVLALALAFSVVFTTQALTRYRVPFEPLIVILACSLLARRRAPATAP